MSVLSMLLLTVLCGDTVNPQEQNGIGSNLAITFHVVHEDTIRAATPLYRLREANFVTVWRLAAPGRDHLPFEIPTADQ